MTEDLEHVQEATRVTPEKTFAKTGFDVGEQQEFRYEPVGETPESTEITREDLMYAIRKLDRFLSIAINVLDVTVEAALSAQASILAMSTKNGTARTSKKPPKGAKASNEDAPTTKKPKKKSGTKNPPGRPVKVSPKVLPKGKKSWAKKVKKKNARTS